MLTPRNGVSASKPATPRNGPIGSAMAMLVPVPEKSSPRKEECHEAREAFDISDHTSADVQDRRMSASETMRMKMAARRELIEGSTSAVYQSQVVSPKTMDSMCDSATGADFSAACREEQQIFALPMILEPMPGSKFQACTSMPHTRETTRSGLSRERTCSEEICNSAITTHVPEDKNVCVSDVVSEDGTFSPLTSARAHRYYEDVDMLLSPRWPQHGHKPRRHSECPRNEPHLATRIWKKLEGLEQRMTDVEVRFFRSARLQRDMQNQVQQQQKLRSLEEKTRKEIADYFMTALLSSQIAIESQFAEIKAFVSSAFVPAVTAHGWQYPAEHYLMNTVESQQNAIESQIAELKAMTDEAFGTSGEASDCQPEVTGCPDPMEVLPATPPSEMFNMHLPFDLINQHNRIDKELVQRLRKIDASPVILETSRAEGACPGILDTPPSSRADEGEAPIPCEWTPRERGLLRQRLVEISSAVSGAKCPHKDLFEVSM